MIRKISILYKRHKCDSHNKCFAANVSHMIRPWDGCKQGEGDGGWKAEPVILLLGKEKGVPSNV